jgi:hypothetical protein
MEKAEKKNNVTREEFTAVTKEPRKGGGHLKDSEPIMKPIKKENANK